MNDKPNINLLTAGPEVDEDDYVRELDKNCEKIGEHVRAQQARQQEKVLEKLKTEMIRLRPHAKRLLTGED